eukprot:208043_1
MSCIPLGRSEGAITIWRRLVLQCSPKRSIQHTTKGTCVDLARMYGLDLSSLQVVPAQALFARSLMLISCTRVLHSKDMDWKQEKHLMRCNNALEALTGAAPAMKEQLLAEHRSLLLNQVQALLETSTIDCVKNGKGQGSLNYRLGLAEELIVAISELVPSSDWSKRRRIKLRAWKQSLKVLASQSESPIEGFSLPPSPMLEVEDLCEQRFQSSLPIKTFEQESSRMLRIMPHVMRVAKRFKMARVSLFGSSVNQLASKESDIDINLQLDGNGGEMDILLNAVSSKQQELEDMQMAHSQVAEAIAECSSWDEPTKQLQQIVNRMKEAVDRYRRKEEELHALIDEPSSTCPNLNHSIKQVIDNRLKANYKLKQTEEVLKIAELVCKDRRKVLYSALESGEAENLRRVENEIEVMNKKIRKLQSHRTWALSHVLRQAGFQIKEVAPQARVPLVKLQPRKEGGPIVDVCIGRKESVLNSRLIGAYMNLDPRVRRVCVLVKQWMKCRGLLNTKVGGISAYGATLLTIHWLQIAGIIPILKEPSASSKTTCSTTGFSFSSSSKWVAETIPKNRIIGNHLPQHQSSLVENITTVQLLHGFMRYYAYSFDWLHGVVSICRSGGLGGGGTVDLVVPQKVNLMPRPVLWRPCIEDPICNYDTPNPQDVGRGISQRTALLLRRELTRAVEYMDTGDIKEWEKVFNNIR